MGISARTHTRTHTHAHAQTHTHTHTHTQLEDVLKKIYMRVVGGEWGPSPLNLANLIRKATAKSLSSPSKPPHPNPPRLRNYCGPRPDPSRHRGVRPHFKMRVRERWELCPSTNTQNTCTFNRSLIQTHVGNALMGGKVDLHCRPSSSQCTCYNYKNKKPPKSRYESWVQMWRLKWGRGANGNTHKYTRNPAINASWPFWLTAVGNYQELPGLRSFNFRAWYKFCSNCCLNHNKARISKRTALPCVTTKQDT